MDESIVARIIEEVRPYTMTTEAVTAFTIEAAVRAVELGLPGCMVECGTWKGGSSFAMLLAQRYQFGKVVKPVWMFDSFQGLPPPGPRDGPLAFEWLPMKDTAQHYFNCVISVDEVIKARESFGFSEDEAIIVEGWFKDSIPLRLAALARSKIALLRVDCDWYEPVKLVLDHLMPYVVDEATVIMDDYYAWDGCARATHEFLARNDFSYRIRSMKNFAAAWFEKRPARIGHE